MPRACTSSVLLHAVDSTQPHDFLPTMSAAAAATCQGCTTHDSVSSAGLSKLQLQHACNGQPRQLSHDWALQGGQSGGCALVVQAAVAAVAVGELALCSPQHGPTEPAQPASRGAASLQAAARSSGDAAAGSAAAAADSAAMVAGPEEAAAAAGSKDMAAAAAAASSKAAESVVLMQLMQCSLALGSHAERISNDTAEAHATELAAIEADDLAAGKKGPKSADSKQRQAQHRAVKAEVQAAQAASARLLATAVAGLAGLTAAAVAAEVSDRAQRSAGATGQPRDEAAVEQRVAERKAMFGLLQQSTELAVSALDAASRMPGFAADFIEVPSSLCFALLLLIDCFVLLANTPVNGVWSQPLWEACLTAQLVL